ncbi:MAG TPA: hypothetical protein VHB50_19335 [Bryobacteraceae bacterium]|nr:hypothetical protein [Bryobacteraceae bacterium]
MKRVGQALWPVILLTLVLGGCAGLPRELRQQAAREGDKLQQAEKQLERTQNEIRDDLTRVSDLFNGAPVATEWPARLRAAKAKLDSAENNRRELERLERQGGKGAVARAERLLDESRRLRQSALDDASEVQAQANRWLDFQRNLPHYLAKMEEEHDAAGRVDLAPVAAAVAKAELDWPGKKSDLETRLNTLKAAPAKADEQWRASQAARDAAAAGKATGPQIATLIQTDDALVAASAGLTRDADRLRAMSGQLYDAWDKILDDLDISRERRDDVYREKIKTVRTHFVDVAAKKTETTTDEKWVDVSPGAYHSVENDLGMAIAHKDAGLYDSEAQNTAQPAGFAYVAPPSVGSNQYGYWTHTDHGSFWTFLPQYLIMRELFWGHNYRPIVINEYNGYYAAQRAGRSYYGQETPAAPPKYGSHGTFTEQKYASSRYVQSGGFRNSAYASHASPAAPPSPRYNNAPNDNTQGRRFGHGSDSESEGKRFGKSSGSPPPGKRFGSPGGGSRPSGKGFGRRR